MATLTPRQLEVVTEVMTGDSYSEVAHRMGISEQTVKNLMAQARARIGASSTIELYARLGWLRDPGAEVTIGKPTAA